MLRKSKHCAHALVMVASIAGVIGCGMSPGEVAATLRPISWPERSSGWSTSNVHSVMQLRGGEGSGESLNVDVGTANCTPRDLEVDPATLAAQREARKLAKAKEKEAKKAAKQVKAEETSGEPPIVSFEEAGQPLPMFGDLQIVQSRTNSGRTFQSLHSLQAAETSWVRCHVQQIRAKSNAVFMVLRHCGQTAQVCLGAISLPRVPSHAPDLTVGSGSSVQRGVHHKGHDQICFWPPARIRRRNTGDIYPSMQLCTGF